MSTLTRIWSLIRRDFRHATGNAVTLVVVAGMIVVPSFYAWFNIAGSWDPYGNTANLKVAVACEDTGYESGLVPVTLNVGERVVDELRTSTAIGYVPTSADDAREGVRSGAYYAALVIPEDFSERILGGYDAGAGAAEVTFLQNQKANAIAQIVTDKAATAVRADIDKSFAAAVTDVGAGVLDELSSLLDDEGLASLAGRLDDAVTGAAARLRGAAGDARAYAELLSSTGALVAGSGDALGAAGAPADEAAGALGAAAAGVGDVSDALAGAGTAWDTAIAGASAGMGDVQDAIDGAFDAADAQVGDLTAGLTRAKETVDGHRGRLQQLADSLAGQIELAHRLEEAAAGTSAGSAAGAVARDLEGLSQRLGALIAELDDLSAGLGTAAGDLSQGAQDAAAAKQELEGLVDDAARDLASLKGAATGDVRASLDELARTVSAAAEDARSLAARLDDTLAAVDAAAGSAETGLTGTAASLTESADALEGAAARLDALHETLAGAVAAGDLAQIRQILGAEPAELAAFMAAPVTLDRTPVFPVENNGSAMAPFYTTLAIWIGGVVLAALVKVAPSALALAETGCGVGGAYLGRLAFFGAVGLAQATLICAGDLFYLGVQCAHPVLFFLTGWVASFVFVNIIYALTAAFGDVGKAVAVVLMVVQVAGSGGTFPPQMLPPVFQTLYRWLPFVHAENAFRAAQFGIWQGDFWWALGRLAAYLVPALILGLALRRRLARANERIEERLAETHVM